MGKGILLILDSVGVGGAPDADDFNDLGANTVGNLVKACAAGKANIGRSGKLKIPTPAAHAADHDESMQVVQISSRSINGLASQNKC